MREFRAYPLDRSSRNFTIFPGPSTIDTIPLEPSLGSETHEALPIGAKGSHNFAGYHKAWQGSTPHPDVI